MWWWLQLSIVSCSITLTYKPLHQNLRCLHFKQAAWENMRLLQLVCPVTEKRWQTSSAQKWMVTSGAQTSEPCLNLLITGPGLHASVSFLHRLQQPSTQRQLTTPTPERSAPSAAHAWRTLAWVLPQPEFWWIWSPDDILHYVLSWQCPDLVPTFSAQRGKALLHGSFLLTSLRTYNSHTVTVTHLRGCPAC